MFDYQKLLDQQTSEAASIQLEPAPEGEFRVFIDTEVEFERWFRQVEIKKGPRTGQTVVICRVPFVLDDENVKAALERDRVTAIRDCWLDFLDDGITLDWGKGKNVDLGQIRAAVGLGSAGRPFNLAMLPGAGPALAKIRHDEYEGRKSAIVDRIVAIK